MGPEKKIQTKAVEYAEKLGISVIRMVFRPGLRRGWPDVLFLVRGGRPLFIEFKAPSKKPTELQQSKIDLLRTLGYDVCCCDSFDAARSAISSAMAAASLHAASRGASGDAGCSRVGAGPRIAQDVHNAGGVPTSEDARDCKNYVGSGSSASMPYGVATRRSKVDAIQRPEIFTPPRSQKAAAPQRRSRHIPDKS